MSGYEDDIFYGAELTRIKGEYVPYEILRRKIDKLLPFFHYEDGKLMYQEKLCVPRKAISTVMQLAHDARTAGHSGYFKTLSRLRNYHWKHKSKDFKNISKVTWYADKRKTTWGRS